MREPGDSHWPPSNHGFLEDLFLLSLSPPKRADHQKHHHHFLLSPHPTMARQFPRRSSRINAIQLSPTHPPLTTPPKKRKYYVISDSESPPHPGIDSDSSVIQVSSPPTSRKSRHPTISTAKKPQRDTVSPKSVSKRATKKKERFENEAKKKESRDVAVGPDESIWASQGSTQKDALDIVQVTFMDEMTCSLCCISFKLTRKVDGSGHLRQSYHPHQMWAHFLSKVW